MKVLGYVTVQISYADSVKSTLSLIQHSLPSVLQNESSGLEATDSAGKAALWMDFFQSVYLPTLDESVINHTLYTRWCISGQNLKINCLSPYARTNQYNHTLPTLQSVNLDTMPAIRITESDVLRKLNDYNDSSKYSGPDNISGFIFNSCSNVLCGPLTYL